MTKAGRLKEFEVGSVSPFGSYHRFEFFTPLTVTALTVMPFIWAVS